MFYIAPIECQQVCYGAFDMKTILGSSFPVSQKFWVFFGPLEIYVGNKHIKFFFFLEMASLFVCFFTPIKYKAQKLTGILPSKNR